ncbi:hypothetical protein NAL32_07390 [Chryseobacterium sp. Ch-15]|uniref:Uncharacterized protein n=1 Tax=Chryseobacterium muglaense TaxID=2893752 RepID=A0A9Q3UQW5_9FLAO|nr:hypothetical protein [Chryseobacterium muglaense]MBD3904454.1 hypothetical protein [Chryseobacterium muglaense]MCC9032727.1 hypothetical protein [Chryseobacterium muglaense]MCM2554216.1 hypothetical protein [Chryseobacterium muglaense]
MKVNELQKQLRIGNYLLGKCEDELDERKVYWEIYQIKDAEDLMSVKMDWDKPIELTEEWLLKFGFEKSYGEFTKSGFKFRICSNEVFTNEEFNPKKICKLKYVHQLQNLYFTLCSDDLELQIN